MAKRTVDSNRVSNRVTNPFDFYPTPATAMPPLLRELHGSTPFVEPCAGDGRLIHWLAEAGHIPLGYSDIDPRADYIPKRDALDFIPAAEVITNPPFASKLVIPLIRHWLQHVNVTVLMPSDVMMNVWFSEFAPHLYRVIPLGRVSWMENGKAGFENYAWLRMTRLPVHRFMAPRTRKS